MKCTKTIQKLSNQSRRTHSRKKFDINKCVDHANIVCIIQSVNLPDVAECIALKTHELKVNFRKTFSWAEVVCKLLNSWYLSFICVFFLGIVCVSVYFCLSLCVVNGYSKLRWIKIINKIRRRKLSHPIHSVKDSVTLQHKPARIFAARNLPNTRTATPALCLAFYPLSHPQAAFYLLPMLYSVLNGLQTFNRRFYKFIKRPKYNTFIATYTAKLMAAYITVLNCVYVLPCVADIMCILCSVCLQLQ